jgi:hypothetical protein
MRQQLATGLLKTALLRSVQQLVTGLLKTALLQHTC